jgi:catechol-2,3-dioxygenase
MRSERPHRLTYVALGVPDVERTSLFYEQVGLRSLGDVRGLGRHAIGSNIIWYLRDPAGNFVEYTADLDRVGDAPSTTRSWQPRQFLYEWGPPVPEEFLYPADLDDLIAAEVP